LEITKIEKTLKEPKNRSRFDAAKNIRLVPTYQEKSVDKYFPQFEKVAANLK
jgi:hypothetical protein